MTLNSQYALWCRKNASFGAHCKKIWIQINPYVQRQKCRPMTLVSWNIRYMRILAGVALGGDLKWEWGCRRLQFLAIWVATSDIRPAILYAPLVGLWLIAKWMTYIFLITGIYYPSGFHVWCLIAFCRQSIIKNDDDDNWARVIVRRLIFHCHCQYRWDQL